MFRSPLDVVLARRAGRVAFGMPLLAAAFLLVASLVGTGGGPLHAARILVGAYVVAAVAYVLAHRFVRFDPRAADPRTLAAASFVVPVVGLSLTLPLTIHLVVFAALGDAGHGFDAWVELSAFVAGPAHVVLAILTAVRGARLVSERALTAPSVAFIYGVVVAVACVPFIVIVLPPLIVAATGIAFLPVLYGMDTIAERERALLAREVDLPRAVVLAA